MSSLEAQLAAFKHRQLNQPVLPRPVVRLLQKETDAGDDAAVRQHAPSPRDTPSASVPATADASQTPLPPPRKRHKTGVVYSQPQDTGRGQHLFTQLTYAVDYLKSHPEPISADKIAG